MKWIDEIKVLSQIARTEPHVAYSGFTHGLRNKYTYTVRTVPNIAEHLKQLDHAIDTELIPALFNGKTFNDIERKLLSLPVKYLSLIHI